MKSPFMQRINDWVNERWPLNNVLKWGLHEQIPGGTRFSYTLGSACMFLLSIQILTGIWQLFFYVPTVDHAYSSLMYLRLKVPFGWLVHGLHYWGGNAFAIVVGLHVMRVFIWGAYKKPRELVWLAGIVLLLLTVGFMFTGPVLPWDKKGYWAGQVGIGIAGSVPIVGPFMQNLMQGADKMGQMALLRMYVFHVALIPFLTGLFVVIHLVAFRQYGSTGPWEEKNRKKVGDFWPEQLFKDALVAYSLFVLLVALTVFFPPEITGLADPMDTLYTPKPEWNFLFLYQVIKYFHGPWEPLGTAGVPTLLLLLFVSLPFVDRSPERNPFKRLFVMFCGFLFLAFVFIMTVIGYQAGPQHKEALADTRPVAVASPHAGPSAPQEPQPPPGATAALATAVASPQSGEELFKTLGCTGCHTVTGKASDKLGPDLVMAKGNNRTRQWLQEQIRYPQNHNPHTIMPPYAHLRAWKINALVDYLESLAPPKEEAPAAVQTSATATPAAAPAPAASGSSPAAVPATASAAPAKATMSSGEQLFNTQGCLQCHTITGHKSHKAGPDLIMALSKQKPTDDWLKAQLMNPQSHDPMSIMPSYAKRLNDGQISNLVKFLHQLSTRKPVAEAASSQDSGGDDEDQGESSGESASEDQASTIVGSWEHGAILFQQSCIMCHGAQGKTHTASFDAPKGVPQLNPLPAALVSQDPDVFVSHIDSFIQHGLPNTEGGPNMPNFGDSHALTQAEIADVEAYVLHLNGVDRAKITNPGVEPVEFFYMLLEVTVVIFLLCALYWWVTRSLKI